ncbi:MAG TPA: N-acetyl sugar amidotransferase [Verrucomicrobiales bacterium]|jgi:N-acetyl sugar amidotransferase|nr:N-acetyl sugar amidotransferase [Verrucomicrobiales bacterium]
MSTSTLTETAALLPAAEIERSYQVCRRCVMDTTDPDIRFDAAGTCHYCTDWLKRVERETAAGNPALSLSRLVERISRAGSGRDYDCVIGVSGGVDSTYTAWVVKKHGLRPLAVHLDNGWNSELAVDNIRGVLEKLKIDLHTHVVDWEEFRDLQRSFFRASVVNIEIPTDHAINAVLHHAAVKHKVKYIVTGGNIRCEGIYPRSWGWYNLDLRHLRAVHRRYGARRLKTLPQISLLQFGFNTVVRGIKTVPILNYLDYSKPAAMQFLEKELGWRPYGGKHYESIFTRFFQGHIQPRKFRVDKRRGHFASLVAGGDLDRQEALNELAGSPYPDPQMEADDLEFFLKKMAITQEEFDEWMKAPPQPHTAYLNNGWFFERAPALKRWARRIALGN